MALDAHTDVESPTWVGLQLASPRRRAAWTFTGLLLFPLQGEAALLPQVTGERGLHGFFEASRVPPACRGTQQASPRASCAGRAPSPDNGAIHHQCLQERVCSGVVQHFLATSASLSPAPWFVPAEAGMNLACCVFYSRYVPAPPAGWRVVVDSPPRPQLGIRERDIHCWPQLLCSKPKNLA